MDLNINNLMLFCTIVDFGKGSKALKLVRKAGAIGGTVFLGKGTVKNDLLNILGLVEIRKEIFITVIEEESEDDFFKKIAKELHLDKPNHGIAFSMPLKELIKSKEYRIVSDTEKKGVENMDYEAIFVIVDKGLSDDVMEAAKKAGSKGGTVIHARGSGSQEKAKLFNIEIEPEKDIVLILSKESEAKKIVDSIQDKLDICKPGAGIIFVLDVNKTLGLYES